MTLEDWIGEKVYVQTVDNTKSVLSVLHGADKFGVMIWNGKGGENDQGQNQFIPWQKIDMISLEK